MIKLIFNADDFGYSRAVNLGIVDAHQLGIVTSTTLMANMLGFDHAVLLAKENPELGIGVHLTLTCGKPLLDDVLTLVNEAGNFKHLSFYKKKGFKVSEDELFREWEAQIKKVINSGIKVTHLDSHHHTHTFGMNQKIAIDLAKKYKLPLRFNYSLEADVMHTDYFESEFDIIGESQNQKFLEMLEIKLVEFNEKIKNYQTVEVMCHPAYLDDSIYEGSSYTIQRMKQVTFLTQSKFANDLKNNTDIILCNYNIFKEE